MIRPHYVYVKEIQVASLTSFQEACCMYTTRPVGFSVTIMPGHMDATMFCSLNALIGLMKFSIEVFFTDTADFSKSDMRYKLGLT